MQLWNGNSDYEIIFYTRAILWRFPCCEISPQWDVSSVSVVLSRFSSFIPPPSSLSPFFLLSVVCISFYTFPATKPPSLGPLLYKGEIYLEKIISDKGWCDSPWANNGEGLLKQHTSLLLMWVEHGFLFALAREMGKKNWQIPKKTGKKIVVTLNKIISLFLC